MKYAHINENGQILGWYDKEIHTSIPTPNVGVSDEVWQNAIDNGHNKINKDGTTEKADFRTDEEKAKQEKAELKAQISKQLEELTVTTTKGNTFDANSQARLDISNGILVSQALGVTETVWRMADNKEVLVTVDELKEALALALTEYAKVKGIG